MESIGDAQSFSGKTSITPSRDFSVETLTGVTLLWKIEYPDGYSTTIRCVVRKMATMEGGFVCFTLQGCNFQMGGLIYDNSISYYPLVVLYSVSPQVLIQNMQPI